MNDIDMEDNIAAPAPDEQTAPSVLPPAKGNSYAVPVSIIIAGALIALAVLYDNDGGVGAKDKGTMAVKDTPTGVMRPVDGSDHILGNPDAPVKVVEYSDLECPFCKRFHITMQEIMQEYGQNGRVAWVYRHLPLDGLHPKARKEAEASECAAKLGGEEKFWAYIDRVFQVTPSNNGLDPAELPKIAEYAGLDRDAFELCLNGGEFTQKIADHISDATNVGARGTPYSIVVTDNGKEFPINGAQPYEAVKEIIEGALAAQ